MRNYAFAMQAAPGNGTADTVAKAGDSGVAAGAQQEREAVAVSTGTDEQMEIGAEDAFEGDAIGIARQDEPLVVTTENMKTANVLTGSRIPCKEPDITCRAPDVSANAVATAVRAAGSDDGCAVQSTGSAVATKMADSIAPPVSQKIEEFTGEPNGAEEPAKDTSGQLEWKRALTRSKRKLLVTTPGISPVTKKSLARKDATD